MEIAIAAAFGFFAKASLCFLSRAASPARDTSSEPR
jgi:hypothetical protein